jgi:hypothetical protein
MAQAESATAPLPKKFLPCKGGKPKSSGSARAGGPRDLRSCSAVASNILLQAQYESTRRLPLVKFSVIPRSSLRCLPHAVASDRRVMCAALHQSVVVRALCNGAIL